MPPPYLVVLSRLALRKLPQRFIGTYEIRQGRAGGRQQWTLSGALSGCSRIKSVCHVDGPLQRAEWRFAVVPPRRSIAAVLCRLCCLSLRGGRLFPHAASGL